MEFVLLYQAPRKEKPSFVAVIKVLSLYSSNPHFLFKQSATICLMCLASSIEPMINITKSSAYLKYIRCLKFGSNIFILGIDLLFTASCLNSVRCDFLNHYIHAVIWSYSLLRPLLASFSKDCLILSTFLSSSFKTRLASNGLKMLPYGIPSLGFICKPVSGSINLAVRDLQISCKVLSQVKFVSRHLIIIW